MDLAEKRDRIKARILDGNEIKQSDADAVILLDYTKELEAKLKLAEDALIMAQKESCNLGKTPGQVVGSMALIIDEGIKRLQGE